MLNTQSACGSHPRQAKVSVCYAHNLLVEVTQYKTHRVLVFEHNDFKNPDYNKANNCYTISLASLYRIRKYLWNLDKHI